MSGLPQKRRSNKIKHCRRVATRYDKLAANYLAFVQLASIRLWLALMSVLAMAPGPVDSAVASHQNRYMSVIRPFAET